jgi:WD40 repeat protein
LKTGELLKVLRPPIGENEEGRIDAVAISPDGQTVAAGGWTKVGNNDIYLFNHQTGEIINKISGLPNVIFHLIYSLDGRFLVVCLGEGGIKIYEQNQLYKEDKNYGADSYWADFDTQGRLVTSNYDGKVRLYDKNFKLIQSVNPNGGKKPFTVRFNPNADKIAVGFVDSTNVQVLSGTDLKPLYEVDTQDISNGNLGSVAWSADGKTLLAGGTYENNGIPLFSWSKSGKGQRSQWVAAQSTIMDIQPLSNGNIVIAAADPLWGVFKPNGEKILQQNHNIADFRGGEILLSNQGDTVQFGYEYGGKKPAQFDLKKRELQTPNKEKNLSKPRTDSLRITNWFNSLNPKLNDKLLTLETNEMSRSLATSHDNQRFILGTEWSLRFFDQKGAEIWKKPVPSVAWAVNIPENGKTVVAAFGDGTIRWYRLSDGVELLAFFPHNDGKRWVLWTASGYYAASAGAEELIGWHVNNGSDRAADFFEVGQFRDQFYRPDIIDLILEKLDENQAIETANTAKKHKIQAAELKLPPVISILQPLDNAEFSESEIVVHYQIRSPSKIKGLRVLIDGVKLDNSKGVAGIVPDDSKTLKIKLPERDLTLSLLAENEAAVSQPSSIRLKWKGKSTEAFVIKPKLYVLAIGTSNYDSNKIPKLDYAHKDAQDFTNVLLAQKDKGLYKDITTKMLLNPNRKEVMSGLSWIEKEPTQHDVAFVFISGHGKNDSNQRYFYLPKDVDLDEMKGTGVAFEEIKSTLENISGKVLLFIDTCHSGNIMGDLVKSKGGALDIDKLANELSSADKGILVYASSKGTQDSLESHDWKNGAFAKSIVEGLNGKADLNQDNKITSTELDSYLSERVKELTNGKQTPVTGKNRLSENLPIAIK